MHLTLYQEIPDDPVFRASWNQLVARMESPEIFYTHEWALAVHRAYPECKPLLFAGYEAGSLIGVVALAVDTEKNVTFLCGTTADYCDFVTTPARRHDFVSSVLEELTSLNYTNLIFANLPAQSATLPALRSLRGRGYFIFVRPAYSCARVTIDSTDQREHTQSSARRRLRRLNKPMGEGGEISVVHSRSEQEIGSLFETFTAMHVARFLAMGKISNLATSARRNFLLQLTSLFSSSGSVVLSRLEFAARPIAWNFGFQFQESWFWYQPTFDREFSAYSPGVFLLTAIVDDACNRSAIKRIDLGLGSEGYKDRLANDSFQTMHATVTQSAIKHTKTRLRYKLAEGIKSVPTLEKTVRVARTLLVAPSDRNKRNGHKPFSGKLLKKAAKLLRGPKIHLFEWSGSNCSTATLTPTPQVSLVPIDLNLLAEAVIQNERDKRTLDYLVQTAQSACEGATGFALRDVNGKFLQFILTTSFVPSLILKSDSPYNLSPDCLAVTSHWVVQEDNSDGQSSLAMFALHLREIGKHAWVAVPSDKIAFLRRVESSGFVFRFSISGKDAGNTISNATSKLNRSPDAKKASAAA